MSPDLSVVASYLIAPDVARHAVESGDRMLPAARIEPVGRLHWFIDRDAASA